MNIINDGANADLIIDFQEFFIILVRFKTFKDIIIADDECFNILKAVVKYKGYESGFSNEGGFSPSCKHDNEEPLGLIVEAVEKKIINKNFFSFFFIIYYDNN